MRTFFIARATVPHNYTINNIFALFSPLGEVKDSYGYGGTGKFSVGNKFQTYGTTFGKGDVITALLDLETSKISYNVNGRSYGVAARIKNPPKGEASKALFPHLLSKNIKYVTISNF